MKYTVEVRFGDGWQFIADFDDYITASRELDALQFTVGRIRHGNQLIAQHVRVDVDELAKWRRRHVG